MVRLRNVLTVLLVAALMWGCEEEPAVDEQPDDQPQPDQQQPQPQPQPQLEQQDDEDDDEMTLVEPSEHAEDLMDQIEDYEQWDHYAGLDTHFESGHPGDVWVIAYGNETGLEAVEQQQIPVPQGTVLVKEEYHEDGAEDPFAVTVMEKLSDEQGDWYWLKADPELQQVVEGPEGIALEGTEELGCINCHAAEEDNDFLMAPGVGE